MSKCGAKTEIYSRVCGYFRPVSNWNKGKKAFFILNKCVKCFYQIETRGLRKPVACEQTVFPFLCKPFRTIHRNTLFFINF